MNIVAALHCVRHSSSRSAARDNLSPDAFADERSDCDDSDGEVKTKCSADNARLGARLLALGLLALLALALDLRLCASVSAIVCACDD